MHARLGWLVLAILLACALPAWSGEGTDALVLHTGERVACQIEGEQDGLVLARIGDRTYRIETANLQGAERAGTQLPDPATVAFVETLSPYLARDDAHLRDAATAALRALGAEHIDAIRAAAARAPDPRVREALGALFGSK